MMASQAFRTNGEMGVSEMLLAPEYDRAILLIYLALICLGLVMVASASIGVGRRTGRHNRRWNTNR